MRVQRDVRADAPRRRDLRRSRTANGRTRPLHGPVAATSSGFPATATAAIAILEALDERHEFRQLGLPLCGRRDCGVCTSTSGRDRTAQPSPDADRPRSLACPTCDQDPCRGSERAASTAPRGGSNNSIARCSPGAHPRRTRRSRVQRSLGRSLPGGCSHDQRCVDRDQALVARVRARAVDDAASSSVRHRRRPGVRRRR